MTDSSIKRVEAAIHDLQQGKMVILTDNPGRENEGDIIFPAEITTPEVINFMIRYCSGIICLSLLANHVRQLGLMPMVPLHENTSSRGTPFMVSIEARSGISTGVSAADRATTILTAVQEHATANDLVKPGHVFPLQAREGGVLERDGHTEGANDLVRLAGFRPAAVLCEVMNIDGTMTRGEQLKHFAEQHQLMMLSIDDVIHYRRMHENLIQEESTAQLPLNEYGMFEIKAVKEKITGVEHMVLSKPAVNPLLPLLVRVHSSCATGDIFGSQRCDCQKQLHHSLQRISEEGGMLIYMHQEGRGIGLMNKIKAYHLQENGFDTINANLELGLPVDSRCYHLAANVLRNVGVKHIRLLTNNPIKVNELRRYGMTVEVEPTPIFSNKHNQQYLKTKMEKLNHHIQDDLLAMLGDES